MKKPSCEDFSGLTILFSLVYKIIPSETESLFLTAIHHNNLQWSNSDMHIQLLVQLKKGKNNTNKLIINVLWDCNYSKFQLALFK